VSKYLAMITIVMSVPLLLSYNLKFGPFPVGLLYAAVWSWAVISYFMVPVLLVLECVVAGYVAMRTTGPERKVLPLHAIAVLFSAASEMVALFVRRHPG
jgi:hypothetical protein